MNLVANENNTFAADENNTLVGIETPDPSQVYTKDQVDGLFQKKQDSNLETTVKTVVGGINELNADIHNLDENKVGFTDYAANNKAGIIKTNPLLGIVKYDDTGQVTIQYASNSQIANKGQYRTPIVPANLDYAIEKGLGANSLTWTDAEKQSARQTIGAEKASGDFELIETITLTEDVKGITRTSEPDGTPYNFKAIMIEMEMLSFGQSVASAYPIEINDIRFGYVLSNASYTVYGVATAFIFNGMLFPMPIQTSYVSKNNTNAPVGIPPSAFGNMIDAITKINFIIGGSSDVVYKSGSVIKIYGVRA